MTRLHIAIAPTYRRFVTTGEALALIAYSMRLLRVVDLPKLDDFQLPEKIGVQLLKQQENEVVAMYNALSSDEKKRRLSETQHAPFVKKYCPSLVVSLGNDPKYKKAEKRLHALGEPGFFSGSKFEAALSEDALPEAIWACYSDILFQKYKVAFNECIKNNTVLELEFNKPLNVALDAAINDLQTSSPRFHPLSFLWLQHYREWCDADLFS